jgi:RecJ-like exonuclease
MDGKEMKDCWMCDGSGWISYGDDYEQLCHVCDGEGTMIDAAPIRGKMKSMGACWVIGICVTVLCKSTTYTYDQSNGMVIRKTLQAVRRS